MFIEHAINEILFTLVLAAVLTGLVCWLFLGSWSTTVNVLLAIPTSILGTFIVMYFFGFTLNTFTVLGLTLVVGIVVDDAIMVLENIYRHREHGEGKVKAASVGAREITFAAAAATLAIVAIFLPVAFMKGIIGKFFFQFGVTISVAVLISLLEALTLAPMRCSRFLEVGKRGRMGRAVDSCFARLSAAYLRWLEPALHHRGRVMLAARSSSSCSPSASCPCSGRSSCPPRTSSRFQVRFQTPVGTSLDATDRVFQQLEAYLASRPEVRAYFGCGGRLRRRRGQHRDGVRDHARTRETAPIDKKLGRRLTQQEFMGVVRQMAELASPAAVPYCRTSRSRASAPAAAAASPWSSPSAAATGTSWRDRPRRSWRRCARAGP